MVVCGRLFEGAAVVWVAGGTVASHPCVWGYELKGVNRVAEGGSTLRSCFVKNR